MAGGVAGAVSRTAVAPLERLRYATQDLLIAFNISCSSRTIMMADPTANKLLPTMRRMWHDGGLGGLFRSVEIFFFYSFALVGATHLPFFDNSVNFFIPLTCAATPGATA